MSSNFKKGDKFIIELGDRQLDEFEIAGTEYYIKIYLLKQLTPYKPEKIAVDERKIADLHKIVNYLLSQPEQRWIPVTERLPRDDEDVIVTCLDDSGDTPYSYTTVAWHYKGMWVCDNMRCPFVIAWMPLPKPYAERKENE